MAEDRLRALKFPGSTIGRVKALVAGHMYPDFSSLKGARRFINKFGDEHVDDLMNIREADREGKGTDEYQATKTPVDTQRSLVQQVREGNEPTSQANLAINGNDLINLGYQPGPLLGQKLKELTNMVVEDPSLNSRDTLLEMARQ
jgi:tRNA nucleotidyltransferase (CCA-adding enzyme)